MRGSPEADVREAILKHGRNPFTARGMWREINAHGVAIGYDRAVELIALMVKEDLLERIPSTYHRTYKVTGRARREPLPTTPGSVVWYDGHPWVLDGEPGVPGPRWWVGVRAHKDGYPMMSYLSPGEMAAYGPAVIYRDPGA